MAAGIYPIYVDMGATWELEIVVEDVAINGTSTPRDFTGATGIMQIKGAATDATPLADVVVTFPALPVGTINLSMDATTTGLIPANGVDYSVTKKCTYDLLVTDALGESERIINGFCYVSPRVSS